MPVHDWTRVAAGIFHHFHHGWIEEIARALNRGLLPPDHYALAEQFAGGLGPDVLTLQVPASGLPPAPQPAGVGRAVALATSPPPAYFHARTEMDQYAARAKAVTVRHASDHRVVAVVEVVSPGNKSNRHGLRALVNKAVELLQAGIHLLIVDVLPPGPRDPKGVHKAIWDEFMDNTFELPWDKPLTLAAYVGGPFPETFVQVFAVGDALPDMPLYLTAEGYIMVPLERAYQAAWEAVPVYWQKVLAGPA